MHTHQPAHAAMAEQNRANQLTHPGRFGLETEALVHARHRGGQVRLAAARP